MNTEETKLSQVLTSSVSSETRDGHRYHCGDEMAGKLCSNPSVPRANPFTSPRPIAKSFPSLHDVQELEERRILQ